MRTTIITASVLLILACACNKSPKGVGDRQGQDGQATTTATKKPTSKRVKRHISIPREFSYLSNLGSVNIIYTQGDYSIEVEGDSALLNYLDTSFESNLLSVSIMTDRNTDINMYGSKSDVTMYISCPKLECVSVCNNGSFESRGTWSGDKIQLGSLASGAMRIEQLTCNNFELQANDKGPISIANLKAKEVTLMAGGSADIDMNVDVDEMTVINDGSQRMKLTGTARELLFSKPDDKNLINEITIRK